VTAQIDALPGDDEVVAAVDTLKLVADGTRLRILWALLHGEHSVNGLAEHVGARPANVSQHLAKLRLARLVTTRRDGNHVYYVADNEHVRHLVQEALSHARHVVHDLPAHGRVPPSTRQGARERSA
jgi:DNA-binding transcriptional ArsR family regulator